MCFICRIGVYFSRNHRKCSQNGEDGNLTSIGAKELLFPAGRSKRR